MHLEKEVIAKIYRKKTIDKYETKDIYLHNKKDTYVNFLFSRIFISIIVFVCAFILLDRHISLSLIVTVVVNYIFIYFVYDQKIKLREKELEKDAGLFFEVLLITLKSGKNLHDALKLTIDNVDNGLSKEFANVLKQTKYGKTLHEALLDFRDKVPSSNIRDIITDLTESYISGREMVSYLAKDIDLLNNKRIYEIKAYINKLPIKISVISVFILIPLMLLLILSPVILEYFG